MNTEICGTCRYAPIHEGEELRCELGLGNWKQYANAGETAQDVIERERAANDMLRRGNAVTNRLLNTLKFVESVYRQNCVAEGEPSSVLKEMQDAIASHTAPDQGSAAGDLVPRSRIAAMEKELEAADDLLASVRLDAGAEIERLTTLLAATPQLPVAQMSGDAPDLRLLLDEFYKSSYMFGETTAQHHYRHVQNIRRCIEDLFAATAPQVAQSVPSDTQLDIRREGAQFWHKNCTNHLGGVMQEVNRDPDKSLIQCLHCGKAGYYPVGGIGIVHVDSITASNAGEESEGYNTNTNTFETFPCVCGSQLLVDVCDAKRVMSERGVQIGKFAKMFAEFTVPESSVSSNAGEAAQGDKS